MCVCVCMCVCLDINGRVEICNELVIVIYKSTIYYIYNIYIYIYICDAV